MIVVHDPSTATRNEEIFILDYEAKVSDEMFAWHSSYIMYVFSSLKIQSHNSALPVAKGL